MAGAYTFLMIGEHLRSLRVARGMSMQDLARASGVAASTIHAIENHGRKQHRYHTMVKLARALNLDAVSASRLVAPNSPEAARVESIGTRLSPELRELWLLIGTELLNLSRDGKL